ncbi:MAG TPA: MFS transporter [Planctomycetota bacterium]|nr:MFS transporter [Planctomycetota bacterium]
MALVAAFLGWMFDGLEMGLFPLAGRPALKQLLSASGSDGDIAQWFAGIIAAFLVGAAAGGVLFGWLGDRVGRVKAMVWSVATYSIFSGLCGFATAPWQIGVLRFIASLGMGGEWALGVSLISEIWPAKSRPLLSGLIGAAANVGFMLVGFIQLWLLKYEKVLSATFNNAPTWRLLFIAGAVPALLTFIIRVFVPESEKWKSAAGSGPKPTIADIFTPSIRRTTLLGALLAGIALVGTWASVQWIPSWTMAMTHNDLRKGAWAQIFAAIGAVVLPLVVALLAEKFNRRSTYVGICLASVAACEVLYLVRPPLDFWFLLTVTVVNGVTGAFYGWLPLYLPELFPTRIRATGSGFCFNIGRLLSALGALFGGQLLKVFNGDYARMGSIICLIYLVGLLVISHCPETKGKPLPE